MRIEGLPCAQGSPSIQKVEVGFIALAIGAGDNLDDLNDTGPLHRGALVASVLERQVGNRGQLAQR